MTSSNAGRRLSGMESSEPATLIDLLRARAQTGPGKNAYTFLADGESDSASLSYAELDQRARVIGALLQSIGAPGERVLLLYPAGLDYLAGLFGCVYAGAVAVPAYPPRLNQSLERLQSIVVDSEATIALTTATILSRVRSKWPAAAPVHWIATESLDESLESDWKPPVLTGDALALLQYTSGSTGEPKGVMVSHENLLENSKLLSFAFEYTAESMCVSWLPVYHDMGLIGGVLQPLYGGFPCVLMSPASFLQRPVRWLQAISRYNATISGGPDFAFDLCARRITAEQKAGLDLSAWSTAFTGSEPIRLDTIDRFVEAFEPFGFRRSSVFTCYGLAESTLIASGAMKGTPPVIKTIRSLEIEQNSVLEADNGSRNARTVVSCGRTLPDHRILIVHPETFRPCSSTEVGEIWISGKSVAQGYWNRPQETGATFGAVLSETGEGPFLRTGDLGFQAGGQLYVTGRLKDLIIIRGLNHYPQDIEHTVRGCHPALQQRVAAAFSIAEHGQERLVIVQELDHRNRPDVAEVINAIRDAVAEHHQIQVHAVSLIKAGTLPRTTSGKIRRSACRTRFLEQSLQPLGEWQGSGQSPEQFEDVKLAVAPKSADQVEPWLVSLLAAYLGSDADTFDPDRPLARYGIDSLGAIQIVHQIESVLGLSIPMARLLQGATLRELAIEASACFSSPAAASSTIVSSAPEMFNLSRGQLAIWFLNQLAPDSPAYNIAAAVRIESPLDPAALQRSFQTLVDRHGMLRTTFSAPHGEPVQRVHERAEVCFTVDDLAGLDQEAVNNRIVSEWRRPFDLENGPLLRVSLLAMPGKGHVLLLVVHHMVADFWSLGVLMSELGLLYSAELSGSPAGLQPLLFHYAQYVQRQSDMLGGQRGEELWSYWNGQLGSNLPALNLPADRVRPTAQTYSGASFGFRLKPELASALSRFSRRMEVTLYTALVAGFQTLLHRYSGQETVLLGSLVAGRNSAETRELVGYFVNPVVLRASFSGNQAFEELARDVHQTVLGALLHQDYPFPLLVEKLQPERDPSRPPIFQAMFIFQKAQVPEKQAMAAFALGQSGARMELGGLQIESLALEECSAQFDLTFVAAEIQETLGISFQYNTDLFDASTISRMAGHLEMLLGGAVSSSRSRISEIPMLTESEQDNLIFELNDTRTDGIDDCCVHELFESQAARTPDAPALVFEDQWLTYGELNRRANQLAHHLSDLGAGPDDPVVIYLDRSLEMMIGLLGVLKAGAPYTPLDLSYPKDRLSYVLEDVGARLVVTRERLSNSLPGRPRIISIDSGWPAITSNEDANPVSGASAGNLAYVIYTSGSTGKPKGVMVTHRSVVNFFAAMNTQIGCNSDDTLLAVTSVSFDISVLELLWTLTRGARVIIAGDQPLRAPARLSASTADVQIDFSLFYFASDDSAQSEDKYRLLFEGARFADRNGFAAIWTPERHFHAFGGLYPNPSVMSAALAVATDRIQIRAGSVVLPLHNPIRIAEEWSLVDNISRGRVGIAFASGWHSDDFVFFPENYSDRRDVMFGGIDTVKRLWRGEAIQVRGGAGNDLEVRIYPQPVQPELPVWITAAGSTETYVRAGEIGANVLTHLLGQTVDEVAERIRLYRDARTRNGHDPQAGCVTLMLHTFIGEDKEAVRDEVRKPFTEYLRTSVGLIANLAKSLGLPFDVSAMSKKDMDDLLSFAFNRYFDTAALFGTPETCVPMIERLKAIGVNEVACLVDFGVPVESALSALPGLQRLMRTANSRRSVSDYSLADQAVRHRPTLMQSTPSMMRMLVDDPRVWEPLEALRVLLLGGEALSPSLAADVTKRLAGRLVNMYGPTETTIWSAACEVETFLDTGHTASIPIGGPIANTQLHVVDRYYGMLPQGVTGDLYIGGDGLARGYLNRPDLTAERFIPDSFDAGAGGRLYKTGDVARRLAAGTIEFLGRSDHQVKIRGFRVELQEIEATLCKHPAVAEAVVLARQDAPGDQRLVAYVVASQQPAPDPRELRRLLKENLPDYMVPSAFVMMKDLPLTANGKIDRKSLPAPSVTPQDSSNGAGMPRSRLEQTIAGIWRQVLTIGDVGVNDNFFDLGGHSLLMAQVHSQLQEKLKLELPLIKLLEHPTISSLARFLGQASGDQISSSERRERAEKQRDSLMRQRRVLARARQ